MTFDPESIVPPGAKIKVIGVGGGGGNAVNTMIRSNLEGVDFICTNTDVQALRFSLAPTKIQVGKELTKGLGAGADPDIGRDAALEDRHEIQAVLEGADMVFITAGMGGGTGTGGAAVIAQIARELGALTVAVVTKPFGFEGKRRRRQAELGIARLRECVDTLITIPNQRLLEVAAPNMSMIEAFRMADEVLVNAVKGISDIINIPGTVNVDFADVKTVMSCMGQALMGIGGASGESRASIAAQQAIKSPLLEDIDIEGATGILLNITAGESVTLMEVNEACSVVQEAAHEDANFIFGAVIDESLGEEMRVTVIATGFPVDDEDTEAVQNMRSSGAIQNHGFTQRLTSPTLTNPLTSRREFGQFAKPQETLVRQTMPNPQPMAAPKAPAAPQPEAPLAPKPQPTAMPEATVAPTPEPAPQPMAPAPQPMVEPIAPETEQQAMPIVDEPAPMPSGPIMGESMHGEFSGYNEAEELANMTFDDIDADASEQPDFVMDQLGNVPTQAMEEISPRFNEPVEKIESKPLRSAHEIASHRIEGATLITDPNDGFDNEAIDLASNEAVQTDPRPMSAGLFSDEQIPEEDLEGLEMENLAEKDAPLDALFGEDATLTTDIDRRIDEALELAERMRTSENAPNASKELDEDLDVPAFLRNGMRDLPLT